MTTNIPTTSIKSSISFYTNLIKVFQNTDLRMCSNFTFYPLGKEIGSYVTFPGGGIDVIFSLHTTRFGQKSISTPNTPSWKITSLSFFWSFSFDYLKVNAVMFINYFFIYVYNNHKNYLIGGGDWKLLFEWLTHRMER